MSHRCTATTQSGSRCRAWAVRGTEPPLCSAHAGRNAGAGAPRGNTNAERHGAYSDLIRPEEMARLVVDGSNLSLEDELALTRMALRRLAAHLQDDETGIEDTVSAAQAIFRGTGRIARLLRDQRALSGDAADGLNGALSQALDELMTEWGVESV